MSSDHTKRIISDLFISFEAFEKDEITKEVLAENIETLMTVIENPDFSLIEDRLIRLIAYIYMMLAIFGPIKK